MTKELANEHKSSPSRSTPRARKPTAFQRDAKLKTLCNMPVLAGVGLLNDPNFDIISLKSTTHQQVHMRCDDGPLKDARVRRAIALTLDRDKLVAGLMKGRALPGNDSPFASVYPSTDPTVPQRKQDIAQAKQLMEAAGAGKGFKVTLTTERYCLLAQYHTGWADAAEQLIDKVTRRLARLPGLLEFNAAQIGLFEKHYGETDHRLINGIPCLLWNDDECSVPMVVTSEYPDETIYGRAFIAGHDTQTEFVLAAYEAYQQI
ncbi:MAG: hypothetical protein E5X77_14485 [Mesorhizobium sp.]|nr:MAG: hypothetical protein E5X77_14485 [Mesorhizobium sp.]